MLSESMLGAHGSTGRNTPHTIPPLTFFPSLVTLQRLKDWLSLPNGFKRGLSAKDKEPRKVEVEGTKMAGALHRDWTHVIVIWEKGITFPLVLSKVSTSSPVAGHRWNTQVQPDWKCRWLRLWLETDGPHYLRYHQNQNELTIKTVEFVYS